MCIFISIVYKLIVVDKLLFYPYPESLSKKLSNLKKINFEKTEKFLRQQEKERKYLFSSYSAYLYNFLSFRN